MCCDDLDYADKRKNRKSDHFMVSPQYTKLIFIFHHLNLYSQVTRILYTLTGFSNLLHSSQIMQSLNQKRDKIWNEALNLAYNAYVYRPWTGKFLLHFEMHCYFSGKAKLNCPFVITFFYSSFFSLKNIDVTIVEGGSSQQCDFFKHIQNLFSIQ